MDIKKKIEDKKMIVELSGKLDTKSSPKLKNDLKKDLPNITELIFDFEELDYISSSGLRLILVTQRTMNKQGTMIIKNINNNILETFDATGFTNILTIE
jgi:anti-sigma B factor antagonist